MAMAISAPPLPTLRVPGMATRHLVVFRRLIDDQEKCFNKEYLGLHYLMRSCVMFYNFQVLMSD